MAMAIEPPTFNVGAGKSYSIFQDATLDHATAAEVKSSAGSIHWISAFNQHTSEVCWLRFYDKLIAAIDEGTTVPDFVLAVGNLGSGPLNIQINLKFSIAIHVTASGLPIGVAALTDDPAVHILYT